MLTRKPLLFRWLTFMGTILHWMTIMHSVFLLLRHFLISRFTSFYNPFFISCQCFPWLIFLYCPWLPVLHFFSWNKLIYLYPDFIWVPFTYDLDLQELCAICTDFIINELWTSNFLAYQVWDTFEVILFAISIMLPFQNLILLIGVCGESRLWFTWWKS